MGLILDCNSVMLWQLLTIIMLLLLVSYFCFENSSIFVKVYNKIYNLFLSESKFDLITYNKIKKQTIKYLRSSSGFLTFDARKTKIELLIRPPRKTVRYNFWDIAMILKSLILIPSEENLKIVEEFAKNIIEDNGKFKESLKLVDECFVGEVFLELFKVTKLKKYKNACDEIFEFLKLQSYQSGSGSIPYRPEFKELLFVDTLGMAVPFLAEYGTTFNNNEALKIAIFQIKEFLNKAIDKELGLPFHAYNTLSGYKIGLLAWTRGIGWLTYGFEGLLAFLPENHKDFNFLKGEFTKLCKKLTEFQQPGEPLRWYLLGLHSGFDTSGSAMIAYSVEMAIQKNILNKEFCTFSENCLNGILKYTLRNGKVSYALADCQGIGHYPKLFGESNYAQATTLALFTLILNRKGI